MSDLLSSAFAPYDPADFFLASAAALLLLFIFCKLMKSALHRRAYKTSEYAQNTNKSMKKALSDKGSRGEYELYRQADKYLDGDAYWLFNVYVPRPNGSTTEIDAILFHASGIYVIESKNYRGQICGNERREQWTQSFTAGRNTPVQTYSFYNPLKQNQIHVDCFRAWLGWEYVRVPIYSVILFGNDCSLKEVRLPKGGPMVDHQRNLPFIVNRISASSSFSDEELVKDAYQLAYPLSQADRITKARHKSRVRSARRHPAYKEQTLYGGVDVPHSPVREPDGPCPLCDGTLRIRVAQKGPNPGNRFLGCSNYPTCRYTKNIDEDP